MALKSIIKKGAFKKFVLFLFMLLTLNGFQTAQATDLPANVVEYITKTYPGSNIRFDGLIELSDGSIYLPVIPISLADHEGIARITMQIPEVSERPDLIIFSNNLSLLKVIKNQKGEKTLISGSIVPLKVKLGLLPQDLVVPDGLIIPPDLNSIIGDLVMPSNNVAAPKLVNNAVANDVAVIPDNKVKEPDNTLSNNNTPELSTKPEEGPKFTPLLPAKDENLSSRLPGVSLESGFGLDNRLLYVTNINGNKIYVVSPKESKVLQAIEVGSLPYNAVLSPDGKKLYVVCMGDNSVAAVNTVTNEVENVIKVGLRPVNIAITQDGTKLFVTNSGSGTVSIIDTSVFEISNNLEVQGMPEGIAASKDNETIYMYNKASGIISQWNIVNPENRQFLFMMKNPQDILLDPDETKLYVISRTSNSLMIYNVIEHKYESAVNVGNKPVAIRISADGKYLYTLDAGDDKISVIDNTSYQIVNTIDLNTGGFPSNLTIIPGTQTALVANAESDKLTLVDLENGRVISTMPVGITSKSIILGLDPNAPPVLPPDTTKEALHPELK